ncbi:hypothetical protein HIM_04740 [Hirsutella minnesotensis 3608]|uniref:Uncharacterized protein n=1 Tax=Hirsutella minnesotensis 3608 TaxID=1043627 RepID=A0A0F7ZL26_9HYPO|nr:hypothetical protein HIM_04740 [Hirsutella minnesotensis 3608]
MSASKNADAMTPAQGEFSSKVKPSKPLTTKGHAPGIKVGNDQMPEFHAETHAPGTAPAEHSFRPDPVSEVPGQADNSAMQSRTSALDTLPGATSADVHQGHGHPGSGMSSQEMHGGKRKKHGAGLEGVGANASDAAREYGFDRDHAKGPRSGGMENYPGAEEAVSVSASELASERR